MYPRKLNISLLFSFTQLLSEIIKEFWRKFLLIVFISKSNFINFNIRFRIFYKY